MKTYQKGKPVKLSANFKSTEFDCHGKGCCTETPIDEELVEILQKVREHFDTAVTVNSGYRCPVHNKNVGGASKTSNHMKGMAADIKIKGVHPVRIARYLETLNVKGRIGCYTYDEKNTGFVHVDTGAKKSRAYYTENNKDYENVSALCPKIRKGDSGRVVIVIQRKLKSLGHYMGSIDGKCGPKTAEAITLFNFYHGRPKDSVWGPKCWEEAYPAK